MYPAITPLDIVPYIIFAIPWFIAVRGVLSGLRKGEMTEHLRRGSGPENNGDETTRTSRKKDEPKSYWALFIFYCLIIVMVPVLIGYSILSKMGALE